jgi:hypothetical protein
MGMEFPMSRWHRGLEPLPGEPFRLTIDQADAVLERSRIFCRNLEPALRADERACSTAT